MSKENPNNRELYLMLYPEDFDRFSTWEDVCNIVGVSSSCTEIRINFDYSDVVETESEEDEYDDEEEDR